MLTKAQFYILFAILQSKKGSLNQRELAAAAGISLGKANACCGELRSVGFIDEAQRITPAGRVAMEPFRVENAIIMAAGMSTRFAPLSYERPKALLKVRGEVLIERQIQQLHAAGIQDITIVVGYMKEKMFYLAEKFGVRIVVNEDYYRYNNTSSLLRVAEQLGNTYICSSDNYFTENVFEPYVYHPYYAAEFEPGETDEYCMRAGADDVIREVTIGGQASWYMIGHVYFTREFSRRFVTILREEYASPQTKEHLWEDLYIRHIRELRLYLKRYKPGMILEFDSLDDLRGFDASYMTNVDSNIFQNIVKVLNCSYEEIHIVAPLKTGLTNLSFVFSCHGKKYVYRHPGVGTDAYINRSGEAFAMQTARRLGLDDTFIDMDPGKGWKISYYIENARTLDYHDDAQVAQAMKILRTLHKAAVHSLHDFDVWAQIVKFSERIAEHGRSDFEDFQSLYRAMGRLYEYTQADGADKFLCHCDSYNPNFLLDEKGRMYLIDWEYAGNADPACDLGTFIACSNYTFYEARRVIAQYLQHEPNEHELRHILAYVALLSYYWFLWALYQESVGKTVGEYLYIWYDYTKKYGAEALRLYGETGEAKWIIN